MFGLFPSEGYSADTKCSVVDLPGGHTEGNAGFQVRWMPDRRVVLRKSGVAKASEEDPYVEPGYDRPDSDPSTAGEISRIQSGRTVGERTGGRLGTAGGTSVEENAIYGSAEGFEPGGTQGKSQTGIFSG